MRPVTFGNKIPCTSAEQRANLRSSARCYAPAPVAHRGEFQCLGEKQIQLALVGRPAIHFRYVRDYIHRASLRTQLVRSTSLFEYSLLATCNFANARSTGAIRPHSRLHRVTRIGIFCADRPGANNDRINVCRPPPSGHTALPLRISSPCMQRGAASTIRALSVAPFAHRANGAGKRDFGGVGG